MFWYGLLIGVFLGAILAWFALAIYLMSADTDKSMES
jgi:hypothetical protein